MPITVQCVCGKVFKVRDDQNGQQVTCQVCGASVSVKAEVAAAAETKPVPDALAAAPQVPASDTIPCPACAEQIPRNSRRCPLCKEPIRVRMTPEEIELAVQEVMSRLAEHQPARDMELKGGFLSQSSKIYLGIAAVSFISFAYGLTLRNGEGFIALGLIFGIGFGIAFLVALSNDYAASHIQDAKSADVAYKRFFQAVQTGRAGKAYAALVPSARQADRVDPIKFNNRKIMHEGKAMRWQSVEEFKKYWKTQIFTGPSSYNRLLRLQKVSVLKSSRGEICIVEGRVGVTSYNQWLLLSILISLWVAVILVLVLQQKDQLIVRKALIRHNGQWFLVSGAWEGELERALQME